MSADREMPGTDQHLGKAFNGKASHQRTIEGEREDSQEVHIEDTMPKTSILRPKESTQSVQARMRLLILGLSLHHHVGESWAPVLSHLRRVTPCLVVMLLLLHLLLCQQTQLSKLVHLSTMLP